MNRQYSHTNFLLIVLALFLLPAGGCVRRPPVATPYPHPGTQKTEGQTEELARPARQTVSENPLTASIRRQARQLVKQGKYEAAVRVLERGLRAEPKNGWLWLDLAGIRLEQGRFNQAKALAHKAYSLARRDPILREQSRNMIDAARQQGSTH